MIPKTIHYCWFGGGDLPPLAIKCLESWGEFLPDYEIIRWDENNFNINSNLFVEQAYAAKKFAFVSDYVRLYALYHHGGIYMDTDVEVLQNLDCFLENKAFSGFETYTDIPTGIIASEKEFEGIKELLHYYDDKSFIRTDGSYDLTTNVEIITCIYKNKGLIQNDTFQIVKNFTFYPKNVFCPWQLHFGGSYSKDVYTVHHFAGSWLDDEEIKKKKTLSYKLKLKTILTIRHIAITIMGKKLFDRIRYRK